MESVFAAHPKQTALWNFYDVEFTFRNRIAGSVPSEPPNIAEMIRRQVAQAMGDSSKEIIRAEFLKRARLTLAEVGYPEAPEMTEEQIDELCALKAKESRNVFRRDGDGLYIPSHSIKAAIKECVNILYPYAKEQWGPSRKGPMSFVAERVFIDPEHIHLGRTEADGIDYIRGQVHGPQGPRSIVTAHEYVTQAVIKFTLRVMAQAEEDVTRGGAKKGKKGEEGAEQVTVKGLADRWPEIFSLMEENGLGSLRPQSDYGKFFTTRFEKVV